MLDVFLLDKTCTKQMSALEKMKLKLLPSLLNGKGYLVKLHPQLLTSCFNLALFPWLLVIVFILSSFVSMRHKHHLLNPYLLVNLFTWRIYNTWKVTASRIWKSCLIYSLHFSQIASIGQAQKGIKQSPYIVIMGTRGIWFGAIFSLYGNCGK